MLLIFSFPITLETRELATTSHRQEDAATYRCECQEGTKSQPLGPHYGQKITPQPERPETHSYMVLATVTLHPIS